MEIKTIQALRAIAAIAVISYHILYIMVHRLGYTELNEGFGMIGVDLFFVISGFIMVYTSHKLFKIPKSPVIFLAKRILRIVPIYWLYTSLLVILLILSPNLFSNIRFNITNILSSYFFLLSEITPGVNGTLLMTGWTLCYEMYFYLLFAFALYFHRKYLLLILSFFFLLGTVSEKFYTPPDWLSVATKPILFEFLLGASIAIIYLKKNITLLKLIFIITFIVTSLIALYNLNYTESTRPLIWGLPCGLILIAAIYLEKLGLNTPKILKSLGDSSYTLYLFHPFILSAISKLFILFALTQFIPSKIFFLLTLISILIVSYIAYLLIEKPINKFTYKLLQKKLLKTQA